MGRPVVAPACLLCLLLSCVTTERVADSRRAPPPVPRPRPYVPPPKVTPRRQTTPVPRRETRYIPSYDPSWLPRCGRISRRWTSIVVHHSATGKGGAVAFDRYHRKKGWDELGYHFVIGNGTDTPDGYIEVGSRWHKQKHGAHCKTPSNYYNEHGIGICLVGNLNTTRPTPSQLGSLERLVRFLSHRCGISVRQITTHAAVTRKTQCPGRYFSLAALQRSLSRPATATSYP
jgi:N-acetylmuramoyl-L-alanine amidase